MKTVNQGEWKKMAAMFLLGCGMAYGVQGMVGSAPVAGKAEMTLTQSAAPVLRASQTLSVEERVYSDRELVEASIAAYNN